MSGAIKRFIKRYKHPFNILLGRATFARPPEVLFTFTSAEDTDRWRLVTDAAFGGRSRATFTLNDDRDAAVFQGAYTVDHGGDDDELLRAGFCSVSSKVFGYGQAVNLEPFDRMVYEVKGDGHTYVANLRLQNMTGDGGDIWQAPLRTTPGAWTQVRSRSLANSASFTAGGLVGICCARVAGSTIASWHQLVA